jgi:putative chitinase
MTPEQLIRIAPFAHAVAATFAPLLTAACAEFGISTPARQAAFVPQVAHESAGFTRLVENLNYSATGLMSVWPKRFNLTTAMACARNPEKIANQVYASRMGNGNVASGDGWRYRGRGLIQITGRANYEGCGEGLGLDLIAHPELLECPEHAARSAGWYWQANGLNALADAGDFDGITRRINGGLNGIMERRAFWVRAKQEFGA